MVSVTIYYIFIFIYSISTWTWLCLASRAHFSRALRTHGQSSARCVQLMKSGLGAGAGLWGDVLLSRAELIWD